MTDLTKLIDPEARLDLVEIDPQMAANALLIIAKRLRGGEPLADNLAGWLADAIEASMTKPESERGKAFIFELGLTARNRRPAADWCEFGEKFESLIDEGFTQNGAASEISANYRNHRGEEISESTAVRLWKQYKKAKKEHDRILREEWEAEMEAREAEMEAYDRISREEMEE